MTKTAKDNLKDHLWPYSDEDIAIIREEKKQLVTATEFAEVHMEKLCIEKKLATAVEALKDIDYGTWFSKDRGFVVDKLHGGTVNLFQLVQKALAEIGGQNEEEKDN